MRERLGLKIGGDGTAFPCVLWHFNHWAGGLRVQNVYVFGWARVRLDLHKIGPHIWYRYITSVKSKFRAFFNSVGLFLGHVSIVIVDSLN